MQCPSCGHANAAGSRFCSQCATALVAPAPVAQAAAPRASHGSPKPAKNILLVALFAAIIPGVMIFVFLGSGAFGDGTVEGQITSEGKPHGDYTMQPSSCFSGEHESFFGVWVTPPLQEVAEGTGFKGGLKLVKGHTGTWEVYVESPVECESLNCVIRPLAADQCQVFDVAVRNTSTTVNDIRVREGHARLSCAFPEGGRYQADLTFSGCS